MPSWGQISRGLASFRQGHASEREGELSRAELEWAVREEEGREPAPGTWDCVSWSRHHRAGCMGKSGTPGAFPNLLPRPWKGATGLFLSSFYLTLLRWM